MRTTNVLLGVLLLSVCALALTNHHRQHHVSRDVSDGPRASSFDDFDDLDAELDAVTKSVVRAHLQKRRGGHDTEENPDVFDKTELDIEAEMCTLIGVGPNFAMCVGNEERSVRFYGRIGIVLDVTMGILTGPLWEVAKSVDALAQGNTGKALDSGLEALLAAVGDPTAPFRSLIASFAEKLDPYYAVCATCAMALAWAIANHKTSVSWSTAAGLISAITTPFAVKGSQTHQTKLLCPMTDDERIAARAIADGSGSNAEKTTAILSRIAMSNVVAIRNNVMGTLAAFQKPFQTLSDDNLKKAENTVANIERPSTELITKSEKGGWLVEDLAADFFDDERPPLTNFKPTFKYRDCNRVCDGNFDVRECSRKCRTCDCTIS